MGKSKEPVTAAVRVLRQAGVEFQGHLYRYLEDGGTAWFASESGVDEHLVIKTLVMEDEAKQPLIVLMHGDREVSVKALARQAGARQIRPCDAAVADRHSGYKVGGVSPFGTRREMPVFCEASIADLSRAFVNGGKRGYIISLSTRDMLRVLEPTLVSVAR